MEKVEKGGLTVVWVLTCREAVFPEDWKRVANDWSRSGEPSKGSDGEEAE